MSIARLGDSALRCYPIGDVNRELRSHGVETYLGRIGSRDRDEASSAPAFVSSHTRDYVISHLGPNGSPAGLELGRGLSPATVFMEALRQSPVISS